MTTTSPQTERLRQLIVEMAFNSNPTPKYPLASGALSKYYIDCKKVVSHAEGRKLVGDLMIEKIGSTPIDAVGGLELGAIPIAVAVSDSFARNGKDVPWFTVRKYRKESWSRKNY